MPLTCRPPLEAGGLPQAPELRTSSVVRICGRRDAPGGETPGAPCPTSFPESCPGWALHCGCPGQRVGPEVASRVPASPGPRQPYPEPESAGADLGSVPEPALPCPCVSVGAPCPVPRLSSALSWGWPVGRWPRAETRWAAGAAAPPSWGSGRCCLLECGGQAFGLLEPLPTRPCRGCCREWAAALGTAGELEVTSAKGRPGVGSAGSCLSRVRGPEGGELEDTEPWVVLVGTQPAEHSRDHREGGPTVTEGQLGVTSWWGPGWWELPRGGSRPAPAVARTLEEAALEVLLSWGAALMEGPDAPACVWPQVNRRAFLGWASPARGRPGTGLGESGQHWATGGRGALARWRSARGPRVGVSGLRDGSVWVQPGLGRSRGEAAAAV